MAGGMGSRLGFDKPKGTYKLKVNNEEISLFEIILNNLIEIHKKFNIYIKWYIMCNKNDIKIIKDFFEKNNYFNYPKKYITFFYQDELPIVDKLGKIMLKDSENILTGPNGNGNIFKKLKDYKLIKDMKKNKIEWVFVSGIDNVMLKNIDPIFLGLTIDTNNLVGSKTLTKKDEEIKGYVYCKKNNQVYLLENYLINEKIHNKKENNRYLYREQNIAAHLFNISKIEEYCNIELRYHAALKHNNSYNNEQIKKELNSYKFEQFIYDSFLNEENILLYSVKDKEFSPVKNLKGKESVETAIKDLELNN